ncbi:uncharacterized protein LOC131893470 isoform X2 [Tigriopus californicus]|nr:uncharacterized protein LOC131893470 isoform X2 [Tigriopus californicus]|eukprot:TCALIF_13905-PA protein Name:"Protein of unknown function" AED:0.05 eAED:0.05 QI:96/0.66/0.5/0.75/0.66/0.5/4/0/727
MKTIPSLDNLLAGFLRTCSITEENSALVRSYGPAMKIMLKLPWVFSNAPGITDHGVRSNEAFFRYLVSNRKTYIFSAGCISTRQLERQMPNELKVVVEITKILHKQRQEITIESLQEIIDKDKVFNLSLRLRNQTSTQEFLEVHSNFFATDKSGEIRPRIITLYKYNYRTQEAKRVNSLIVIELIRSYTKEIGTPIDIVQLYNYLHEISFGVRFSALQKFVFKFYHSSYILICPESQPSLTKPRPKISESDILKIIWDTMAQWPVTLSKIREELNQKGISMANCAIRSIIEGHFPDHIIQGGFVLQNHQPYMKSVQEILKKQCPMSLTELRKTLVSTGVDISRTILTDLVVKSLAGYFTYKGEIYLPTSKESGELMADFILNQLHLITEGICPILLEDVVIQLASKRILITKMKLKSIIAHHSEIYKCDKNFVCMSENGMEAPDSVEVIPETINPQDIDKPKIEPQDIDLPRIEPQEMDLPKFEPQEMDLPKIEPQDTDPPKIEPQDMDLPKIEPQEMDLSKIGPQEMDLPKIEPQEMDLPNIEPQDMDLPKIEPQDMDRAKMDPQSVGELVSHLKNLVENDNNSVTDLNGNLIFTKAYLDEIFNGNEAYTHLKSIIVTEDGIGLAKKPQTRLKPNSEGTAEIEEANSLVRRLQPDIDKSKILTSMSKSKNCPKDDGANISDFDASTSHGLVTSPKRKPKPRPKNGWKQDKKRLKRGVGSSKCPSID